MISAMFRTWVFVTLHQNRGCGEERVRGIYRRDDAQSCSPAGLFLFLKRMVHCHTIFVPSPLGAAGRIGEGMLDS